MNCEEPQIPEYHEVGTTDAKRIEYPDKTRTGGIDTCYGIGILNTKTQVGYLCHYHRCDTEGDALVKQAINEADSPDDLTMKIAGNTPLSKEQIRFIKSDVELAANTHREFGEWLHQLPKENGIDPDKVKFHLNEKPDGPSYEMEVDTETGEITVTPEAYEGKLTSP